MGIWNEEGKGIRKGKNPTESNMLIVFTVLSCSAILTHLTGSSEERGEKLFAHLKIKTRTGN